MNGLRTAFLAALLFLTTARACPAGAISGQVRQPHKIDTKVCIKCGLCMQNCVFGAVYTK